MVDDVLMEFDGQLSFDDITNMTEKELSILRKHRREHGKSYREMKQMEQLVGVMGQPIQQQQPVKQPMPPRR